MTRLAQPIVGTMIREFYQPIVVKLAQNTGLDFLIYDMEHGPFDYQALEAICCAAEGTGVRVIVRVPEGTKATISRVLDLGAKGVMVPMLETVEQAELLVKYAKFAPIGGRGLSSKGGHSGYRGFATPSEFMAEQNEEVLTIAQIETGLGVENAEAIAAVTGIDTLLVGPNDLSVSLGTPDDQFSDTVNTHIERIIQAGKKHDKLVGFHGNSKLLDKWSPYGLDIIANFTDIDLMEGAMRELETRNRQLTNPATLPCG